jgi:hypothetical protein
MITQLKNNSEVNNKIQHLLEITSTSAPIATFGGGGQAIQRSNYPNPTLQGDCTYQDVGAELPKGKRCRK